MYIPVLTVQRPWQLGQTPSCNRSSINSPKLSMDCKLFMNRFRSSSDTFTTSLSFRWVQLPIDELERCENQEEIEKQLESLPHGLPRSYERILFGLHIRQRKKAAHILTYLSLSSETMKKFEIENSLQIGPDAPIRIVSSLKSCPGVALNMLPGLVLFTPQDLHI